MMISSANPLLPVATTSDTTASLSGAQTLDAGGNGFGDSLLAQLGLLQANLGEQPLPDMAQEAVVTTAPVLSEGLQNLAALVGQSLPAANDMALDAPPNALDVNLIQSLLPMQSQTAANQSGATKSTQAPKTAIDLDDTLNTLADVLSFLQELAPVANAASSPKSTPFQSLSSADESVSDATDAVNTVDAQASLNNVMAHMLPSILPVATAAVDQAALAASSVNASIEEAVFNKNAVATALNASSKPLSFIGTAELNKTADGAVENSTAANALSALLALGAADSGGGSGSQSGMGRAMDDFASQLTPSSLTANEKAPFSFQADIAQLNQAVGGDGSKVEVSAMTRPLSHPQWDAELADKLVWMHKQAVPAAEMRLNPEHLGPISIRVDVDQNDQATVSFTAQHAVVKETIEAAIPKLREMLGEQQVKLVDVNVSQQQSEQRQPREFFQMASDQGKSSRHTADEDMDAVAVNGEVDLLDEVQSGRAVATNGLLSLFA